MLNGFGYIKETANRYDMSLGSMILLISKKLIQAGKADLEIRLVNTFLGELDKFAGVTSLISSDWNTEWEVSVYSIRLMVSNETGVEFLVVTYSDELASADDAD